MPHGNKLVRVTLSPQNLRCVKQCKEHRNEKLHPKELTTDQLHQKC
uniref:Uncharacterized protein n=1 Tax=Anguilla anguilla TaxID=7936 RepID=A0A0E9QS37_ANGAN